MMMEKLINLYKQWAGEEPADVIKLAGQGSNRQYFRIIKQDGDTVIGVIGTSRDEDHAFVYLANHFNLRQLPVPKILAVSDDELCYIQTDLGGTSLFDAIKGGREAGGRYNQKEKELLKKTIRELPNIQLRGARGLDWQNCYPQPEFDVDSVLFDLNYFKYCFLKPTDLDFHELKLEANFRLFAKDLTSEKMDCFLYRDFQARNIMLDDKGNPYFIDFQGGRKGPFYYDLASFLWQASAKYSVQAAPGVGLGVLSVAEELYRGTIGASFRESLESLCALPYLTGVGCLRIPWLFRAQEAFHRQYSACYPESARSSEDGREGVPLSLYDGYAAPTYRIAAVQA